MSKEIPHERSTSDFRHPIYENRSFIDTAIFKAGSELFLTNVREDSSEMHDGRDFIQQVGSLGLQLHVWQVRDLRNANGVRFLNGVTTTIHPEEGTLDVTTDTGEVFTGVRIKEYRFGVRSGIEYSPEKDNVNGDATPEDLDVVLHITLSTASARR